MTNEDYQKTLSEYLKRVLKLEIEDDPDHLSASSSSKSPSYYPSRLLDLKFKVDEHANGPDLDIFKKVFGSKDPSPSQSTKDSIINSEYRFLAAPPLNASVITDCVAVPTSKHVAQILGKKGCKIRALRETTKTFIRSPLPNEEPVFIVKGKKDGVATAVEAIKSASKFFTSLDNEKEHACSCDTRTNRGESIVVKLKIPEPYVGLVVGIKGCTIKEIEKATNTYIKSPTLDLEPVFTITGAPEYCEKAMNFISRYMDLRGVGPGIFVENFSNLEVFPGKLSSSWNSCAYSFTWVHINPAN